MIYQLAAFVLFSLGGAWEASGDFRRFHEYRFRFGKTYESALEIKQRFENFLENEKEIERLNAMGGDAVFGWTKFSDMSKQEFKEKMLGYKRDESVDRSKIEVTKAADVTAVTGSLDWRTLNGTTPVKDQGQCGSCWAFSATEGVESAHRLAFHSEVILGPQQVVSCDKVDGGCNGGDLPSAFEWIESNGGIDTEADYPYKSGKSGRSKSCKSSKGTSPDTLITAYKYATTPCSSGSCKKQDEDTLATNMGQVGPISICVNAENWQNYESGVMSKSTCGGIKVSDLDHCVQLVAYKDYGEDGGYWSVKNSWADDWGVSGYIRLSIGENTCGLADEAMYVTVS